MLSNIPNFMAIYISKNGEYKFHRINIDLEEI